MAFSPNNLLLYAITDRSWVGRQSLLEQIESALRGGATMVQLREKGMDPAAFQKEAAEALALCRQYGAPLIINDNVDIALAVGADGVHVGAADQPVAAVRARAGGRFLIGATAKTVAQAQNAQAAGADYLGVGAVFPSPTKPEAIRITPALLREICASVSIPAVAIGGINLENMDALRGTGIAGVALVSAVFAATDIEAATRVLVEKARAAVGNDREKKEERL